MELMKSAEPLRFKHDDVTFLIKPHATVGDRFDVELSGEVVGEKLKFNKKELAHLLIQKFVIGWEGVTENGERVPWSYDVFMDRFPASADIAMLLLGFIQKNTDIFADLKVIKNGLRESSNGHGK